MASTASALPYHEPGIVTILILASFLLLQNAINWAFDRLLFCGLIGQIAIGVAWGTPGAKWLPDDVQHSIVQLGYLGLILLVFEGELYHP
jgi:Kef-type K+ transport system membrane component KefB